MIKITDKYYLDSDPMQFIISERSVVQDVKSKNYGQERFTQVAFFGNLEQLKHWLVNKSLMENLDLLNNIDECIKLSRTIDKAIKE